MISKIPTDYTDFSLSLSPFFSFCTRKKYSFLSSIEVLPIRMRIIHISRKQNINGFAKREARGKGYDGRKICDAVARGEPNELEEERGGGGGEGGGEGW